MCKRTGHAVVQSPLALTSSVLCAVSRAKKISQWIQSILDIQKSKPPATVGYSKTMPDIELLMQEWPPEIEAFVRAMKLPSGDLVRCC